MVKVLSDYFITGACHAPVDSRQGESLEVLFDDEWVQTRMEMNPAREWYLVGTPYCGDLEYIRARIPE